MTNLLICQELPEPRRVESLWNLGLIHSRNPSPTGPGWCVAATPLTAGN